MKTRKFSAFLSILLVAVMLFSMIPATVSADALTATKVNNLSEITSGDYVISVVYGGKSYAFTGKSGDYGAATEITPSGDTISDATGLYATLTAVPGKSNTYTIEFGSTVIGYDGSGTKFDPNASNWVISANGDGFRIVPETTATRAIAYQNTNSRFAVYAISNASNASYAFDIILYKVGGTSGGGTTPTPTPDPEPGNPPAADGLVADFEFGTDIAPTEHKDGSDIGASKSYTENGYTLAITGASKVFDGGNDAQGKKCLKLGTSSVIGKFTFTAPSDVTKVIIYVAKYKDKTTKISVNGTAYTIDTLSNNGEYTAITVDTSSNKTVEFTTVSGGVRCMIDSIEFYVDATPEPTHTCKPKTYVPAVAANCMKGGNIEHWICECGEKYLDEACKNLATDVTTAIDATNHTGNNTVKSDANGHWTVCDECGATVVEKEAHTYENGKDGVCTASGCGYEKAHVCEAASHTDAEKATCLAGGTIEYWTCGCGCECGDEACKDLVTDVATDVDASNHAGKTVVKNDADGHWTECECGATVVEKEAHIYANGKDGVCTANCGYTKECDFGDATCTEPATCKNCGAPSGDALGHDMTFHAKAEADCNNTGHEAYYECNVCGKLYSDANGENEITAATEIPATKHPNKYLINEKEPTLNDKGYTGDYYCPDCDTIVSTGTDIPVKTGAVASVSGYNYATFEEAVANADGKTVVLLGDVVLTNVLYVNGTQTWNLAGYTLTSMAISDNYAIVVKGDLTIKDGEFLLTPYFGIGVLGKLTVDGGRFIANGETDYLIGNWGTTVINGGTFNGYYSCVLCEQGTTVINGGNFKVEGYVYDPQWDDACDLFSDAELIVKGGTFSCDVSEFCENGCTAYDEASGKYVYGAHKYVAGEVVKATCMAGGYTVYTCACGNTYNGDTTGIDANNHVVDAETLDWAYGDHTHYKTCKCNAKLEEEAHDGELSCSICGHKTIGVFQSEGNLYFIEWNGKLLKGKFYVTEETANGYVNAGWYYADENGKFVNEEIILDEGVLRYVVGGKTYYNNGGAIELNGKIYFIEWDGRVQIGKFYVTEAMIAASEVTISGGSGWYYTDDTGAMIMNGFVE